MAQYTFRLRGWPAVAALAGLAAITSVQMYSRVRPVNDAMRDAVRSELLNEYSGRGRKDFARVVAEARESVPVEPLPEVVQRNIEFASMGGRGSASGAVVVRAEVRVDGGPPPDGHPVRYFWVSRKFGSNSWMVISETNEFEYFMALLPETRRRSSWW